MEDIITPVCLQNNSTEHDLGSDSDLDLLLGHLRTTIQERLTVHDYKPVTLCGRYPSGNGWFVHSSHEYGSHPYVAKVQHFDGGGYEVTIGTQDLERLSRLIDNPPKRKPREQSEQNEHDLQSSCLRSKRKVRHLIKSMGCDRLLTLTKRERDDDEQWWGVDDWAAAWKRLNRLLAKYGYPLKYVAVLEKHKKGNYHLHAAIVGRVNVKILRGLWLQCLPVRQDGRTSGNVDIKMRQNVTEYKRKAGLARYVSKYITKQSHLVEFNKKRYWSSRQVITQPQRYILQARTLHDSLLEIAGILGIDGGQLLKTAFVFPNNAGAWFNYDDNLEKPVPF